MYQLTDGVAVYGQHEDAPSNGVVLVPHEVAAYPWWSESTRRVIDSMPDLAGKDVLDFGCGASAILGLVAVKVKGAATLTSVEEVAQYASIAEQQIAANGLNPDVRPAIESGRWDFALANVGDAALVGYVSTFADHGIGSDKDGSLIEW